MGEHIAESGTWHDLSGDDVYVIAAQEYEVREGFSELARRAPSQRGLANHLGSAVHLLLGPFDLRGLVYFIYE